TLGFTPDSTGALARSGRGRGLPLEVPVDVSVEPTADRFEVEKLSRRLDAARGDRRLPGQTQRLFRRACVAPVVELAADDLEALGLLFVLTATVAREVNAARDDFHLRRPG